MEITKAAAQPSRRAKAEWFTGTVWQDPIVEAPAPARIKAVRVTFEPGARTAWHTHPHGQTIYITEGVGLVQRRGGPVEVVHPGDRVFFAPGEEHWHGAAPDRLMAHVAVLQVDDQGTTATWLERVTDEEYGQQPG